MHQMATDELEIGRRSTDVLDLGDDYMPSFFAEMAFIKSLHFCEDSTSAVYFALSTFAVRRNTIFVWCGGQQWDY